MTKEEAKHLSEVLKAYSEGKTIERHVYSYEEGEEWQKVDDLTLYIIHHYPLRIKPEPKYRPYRNAEEFLNAQKEHGPYIILTDNSSKGIPTKIRDTGIEFGPSEVIHTYNKLLGYNKWQDGTSCGILEK